MRRFLNASCLALLLTGPASAPGADGGTRPPAADAGVPPAAGGSTIHPSRLEEARSLVPPPLLYGQFRPVVGTWVEYELSSKQATFPVRAAVVGQTLRGTTPLYQVELAYDTKPRTLIVLWVAGSERPMVERLAVYVAPHAPISIPVDLFTDQPELRGELKRTRDTELRGGPFAGKARQLTFQREAGATVEVVTTRKVPLFGVESVRGGDATWVARKTGTGARPELSSIPISVPRVPGQ
jgi:hypothetical protein